MLAGTLDETAVFAWMLPFDAAMIEAVGKRLRWILAASDANRWDLLFRVRSIADSIADPVTRHRPPVTCHPLVRVLRGQFFDRSAFGICQKK